MIQASAIPGVHYGVSAPDYFAIPACSNSRMQVIEEMSPAHLRYEDENPPEAKRHFMVGRAFHSWLLEPETFWEHYETSDLGLRSIAGKSEVARIAAAGRTCIQESDFEMIKKMAQAVRSHAIAGPLLEMAEMRELTIVWNEPVMTLDNKLIEVQCKGRVDLISTVGDEYVVADPKSCQLGGAHPRAFLRSLYKYGYHRQAAWYTHGLKRNKIRVPHFMFIACEKEAPFAVSVLRVGERPMADGTASWQRALVTYATCLDRGEFPAYQDTIHDLE